MIIKRPRKTKRGFYLPRRPIILLSFVSVNRVVGLHLAENFNYPQSVLVKSLGNVEVKHCVRLENSGPRFAFLLGFRGRLFRVLRHPLSAAMDPEQATGRP